MKRDKNLIREIMLRVENGESRMRAMRAMRIPPRASGSMSSGQARETLRAEDNFPPGWAILELMGHRRLAGWVSEQDIGGARMLRIDVYDESAGDDLESRVTQFYSASAVYALTPASERVCRRMGETLGNAARPVSEFDLALPAPDPVPNREPNHWNRSEEGEPEF